MKASVLIFIRFKTNSINILKTNFINFYFLTKQEINMEIINITTATKI